MICIRSSKNRNKSVFILFLLFFFHFFTPSQIICGYSAMIPECSERVISMLVGVLRTRAGSLPPSLTSLRDIEFCRFCRNGPILDTAEMYTCIHKRSRVYVYINLLCIKSRLSQLINSGRIRTRLRSNQLRSQSFGSQFQCIK